MTTASPTPGVNEMDPPLCGAAVISHNEVSTSDHHVTARRRVQLSLSRLNHRLPGGEAHPEVVQGTAEFHHQIADTLLPQADAVFDDAAAFDTAVDMLDAQPTLVECLIGPLLLPGQLLAAGFLGRHQDLHLGERERHRLPAGKG